MKAVPCLFKNLEWLSPLFHDNKTALWVIWGNVSIEVLYTFGGASGSWFGDSWTEEDFDGLRFGVWNEKGDVTSFN